MYKALALAALVGTAAAQWTQTIIPTTTLSWNGSPIYTLMLSITADAGYQTEYNPRNFAPSSYPSYPGYDHSESYDFNIYSYVMFTYTHSMGSNDYTATYQPTFQPFYITPYGQSVKWNRFD